MKINNVLLKVTVATALLGSPTVFADSIGSGGPSSNTPDAHQPVESSSTDLWQQLLEWFDVTPQE